MEIFDKMMQKGKYFSFMKAVNEKPVSMAEAKKMMDFAKDNPQYRQALLTRLLEKSRQHRKADVIIEIMQNFSDYIKKGDAAIRQMKDANVSVKLLKTALPVDTDANTEIVLKSENVNAMLDLALWIQEKDLHTISYVKLEDRAFDVAKEKLESSKSVAYPITQAFCNYVLHSKKCEIKQEIVNDILFKSPYFGVLEANYIAKKMPENVDVNDYALFLIQNDAVADLFLFLEKNKDKKVMRPVLKQVAEHVNGSGDLREVKGALKMLDAGILNIEKIQDKMISIKAHDILLEIAKMKGADIKKIENHMLNYGNFDELYNFAIQIKKSDKQKIYDKMETIYKKRSIRNEESAASFSNSPFTTTEQIKKMNEKIKQVENQEMQLKQVKQLINNAKLKNSKEIIK